MIQVAILEDIQDVAETVKSYINDESDMVWKPMITIKFHAVRTWCQEISTVTIFEVILIEFNIFASLSRYYNSRKSLQ